MSTLQTTIRIDVPYRTDFVHFLESASYSTYAERNGELVVSHHTEIEKRVLGSFLRTWSAMFPYAPLEVDPPRRRRIAYRTRKRDTRVRPAA